MCDDVVKLDDAMSDGVAAAQARISGLKPTVCLVDEISAADWAMWDQSQEAPNVGLGDDNEED